MIMYVIINVMMIYILIKFKNNVLNIANNSLYIKINVYKYVKIILFRMLQIIN